MAYRINGRGSYVIDRCFGAGIGRVKRATGTHDRKMVEAINGMLTLLWDRGRLDVVEQVRDGCLHPLRAYQLFRMGGFDAMPSAEYAVPVQTAMREWAEELNCSDPHRHDILLTLRILTDGADTLNVAGLPATVRRLAEVYADRPRMFNKMRAHVQAFLRDLVGRNSQVWRDVANVGSLMERKQALPGLRVQDFEAKVAPLPEPYPAMLWTIVLTGMLPKEYFGRWEADATAIRVFGTKRRDRGLGLPGGFRSVPRIGIAVPPQLPEDAFRRAVPKLTGFPLKQLRNTYARWLAEADVVKVRRRAYMGHAPQDMTEHYEQHDVTPELAGDAALLRGYLTARLARPDSARYVEISEGVAAA